MRNIWIIAIIVLVVGFLGLYIGFLRRPVTPSGNASTNVSTSSPQVATLTDNIRQVADDNIIWTRMYLIDKSSNNGFVSADTTRLEKNEQDIANIFKAYYGNDNTATLTTLLKQNNADMMAFAQAVISQDTTAQDKASTMWHTHANQLADLLARTNSHWADTDARFMMKSYVDATKQEVVDIVQIHPEASVKDFDNLHQAILQVADALSSGIRQDFPERF